MTKCIKFATISLLELKSKMTNYDQLHPADPPTFQHEERIQFRDDSAITFKTPGDVVELGDKASVTFAQDLGGGNSNSAVIVKTESGNAYGVGCGVIINARSGNATRLPDEMQLIEIGKPWTLPNGGNTSDVNEVMFRYKPEIYSPHQDKSGQSSPFDELLPKLREARRIFDAEVLTRSVGNTGVSDFVAGTDNQQ